MPVLFAPNTCTHVNRLALALGSASHVSADRCCSPPALLSLQPFYGTTSSPARLLQGLTIEPDIRIRNPRFLHLAILEDNLVRLAARVEVSHTPGIPNAIVEKHVEKSPHRHYLPGFQGPITVIRGTRRLIIPPSPRSARSRGARGGGGCCARESRGRDERRSARQSTLLLLEQHLQGE